MRWWGAAGAGGLLRSRGASMLRGCGAPGALFSLLVGICIPVAATHHSCCGRVCDEHQRVGGRRAQKAMRWPKASGPSRWGRLGDECKISQKLPEGGDSAVLGLPQCRLRVEGLSLPPSWCVGCRQVLRDGCAASVVVLAMHRSCHFAHIIQRRNCSNNYGIPHTFVDSRWRAGEPEMRSADAVAGS